MQLHPLNPEDSSQPEYNQRIHKPSGPAKSTSHPDFTIQPEFFDPKTAALDVKKQ